MLLSTHGMDVTAQRQADCHRRREGAWVLAPSGRHAARLETSHGFNWQGKFNEMCSSLVCQGYLCALRLRGFWYSAIGAHCLSSWNAW